MLLQLRGEAAQDAPIFRSAKGALDPSQVHRIVKAAEAVSDSALLSVNRYLSQTRGRQVRKDPYGCESCICNKCGQ
jgi:hypothetical protein